MQDESEFISWVKSMITVEGNLLGHDEDAIAVEIGKDIMVINIDGWVASTDRPTGMSYHEAGYRAVANAISDVIVKGARPHGMIISSSLSNNHQPHLQELITGFNQASKDFSVPFFGGDINSSDDLVIDVTVWGVVETTLVPRSGASVGEKLYWLGPALGCTAAALGILLEDWIGDTETALRVMGRPRLFPEFLNIPATAAIDCSDGLARSLYLLAEASNVGVNLVDLTNQIQPWIEKVAKENHLNLSDLIFYGGEELGVVFSLPADMKPDEGCIYLGEIVEQKGVKYHDQLLHNRGWDHFLDD